MEQDQLTLEPPDFPTVPHTLELGLLLSLSFALVACLLGLWLSWYDKRNPRSLDRD